MSRKEKNTQKKKSSFSLLMRRLFGIGGTKELGVLEEEQLQSPFRTVVRNFKENRLAMVALITFLLIFALVIIGPFFFKINLSDYEGTQANIAPGMSMMRVPSELNGSIMDIASGSSFSLGCDKDGYVYVWGKTKIGKSKSISDIPAIEGKVVQVAAGFDHALALTEDGKIYAWGNTRFGQCDVPRDAYKHGNIIQIAAGYQISAAVTEKGYVVYWGNENLNDVRVKRIGQQGTIAKVVFTSDTLIAFNKDGEVVHLGKEGTGTANIPEISGKVVDIAAGASSAAAILEDGTVKVWGNTQKGEKNVPEFDSKPVKIEAGRYHYTVLTEKGSVYSWGLDNYGQADVPAKAETGISDIYSGYYQNYAVKEDGKVATWGLKGYLLGSDDLGRDVFSRLINGGRMTMTVGAVAVVISTIIGIIIGGISGYFGGKIDIVLQRFTEVISAMPFLPFAMILTTIISNRIPENMRITLIMIVLGVLSWPQLARLVRAQVLSEREQEFVTAAKAMGVKQFSIVFRHIIPNVISVIIVTATLDFASCMLTEATLSYLGFGVLLPRPTWGNMLFGCNDSVVIQNYWWRWVFAAVLLSICVICINTIGDGLRDAIDPKSSDK